MKFRIIIVHSRWSYLEFVGFYLLYCLLYVFLVGAHTAAIDASAPRALSGEARAQTSPHHPTPTDVPNSAPPGEAAGDREDGPSSQRLSGTPVLPGSVWVTPKGPARSTAGPYPPEAGKVQGKSLSPAPPR